MSNEIRASEKWCNNSFGDIDILFGALQHSSHCSIPYTLEIVVIGRQSRDREIGTVWLLLLLC